MTGEGGDKNGGRLTSTAAAPVPPSPKQRRKGLKEEEKASPLLLGACELGD